MAVSISGEGAISGSSSYSFDSNVSIAGTTTIEDVTSVDSVGIITAQSGIHVTGGVQVATGATISGSTNIITASTNGSERLRVTSDGQVNINASTESVGGRVVIKNNVDYTTTDFDDNPTLYLLNDDRTTGVSEAAILLAGRNSSGSTFRAAISGNGSTGLKFYTDSNAESDDTPAMLINGSGKVGIGTDNPTEDLHVYEAGGSPIIKVETTSPTGGTTLQLKGGSGRIDFGVTGGSSNRGRILYANAANTLTGAAGDRMEFFTNNDLSNSAILITSDNKIGIGSDIPAQALDVVGRISKTEYEPGELIECIETIANGIQVTVGSGSYTPTNVTAVQDLASTYADINGSEITYNVPVGTKRLIYDFWVYMRDKDVGPLLHFKGLTTPDGSSTYSTVNTSRATWRGPTASADMQIWIHNRMVLFDYDVEELIGDGMLKPLGGTTRKMKFQCREYSASYEAQLHLTQHWDGGGTDILVRPQIRIAAYA